MAEYASKGVAGSGLGLGIAGTALANAQCIWTWEHEKMMDHLAKVKLKQELYRK